MTKEHKEAIEYLKTRLYGNEGCKYIDVAQEDLRIFINLVDRLQKENEELKDKYATFVKMSSEVIANSIPVQKVKDKISERQFELQQEYKDFEDDAILIVLQKLLEGRK